MLYRGLQRAIGFIGASVVCYRGLSSFFWGGGWTKRLHKTSIKLQGLVVMIRQITAKVVIVRVLQSPEYQ